MERKNDGIVDNQPLDISNLLGSPLVPTIVNSTVLTTEIVPDVLIPTPVIPNTINSVPVVISNPSVIDNLESISNIPYSEVKTEINEIKEPVEEVKLPVVSSHVRSASEVPVSPIHTDNEIMSTGEHHISHTRSPSDSHVVLASPRKFVPCTIQTNWSSYRVRTMQMETLKNWVNYKLAAVGVQVDDITTGFGTGNYNYLL